jgi:hypothetical protein
MSCLPGLVPNIKEVVTLAYHLISKRAIPLD